MLKNKSLTIFLAVIIVLMIGFGIAAATGGLSFFGIKPNISSSANLVGSWSLNESDLTETVIYESDFSTDADGFNPGSSSVAGNQDNVSDGNTSLDDCLKITVDSSDSNHIAYKSILGGDNLVKVIFKYYIPATNVNVGYLYVYNGISPVINSLNTVGAWTEYSGYHTISDVSVRFRLGAEHLGNGIDHLYLRDFKFATVDTAIKDSSGNGNDGEIFRTNLVDGEGIENFTLNGDGDNVFIIASDIKEAGRTYRYTFRVTDAATGGTVKIAHSTYTSDDRTVDDNGNNFNSIGAKTLTFITNSGDIGSAHRVQVSWFSSINGDDYTVADFKVEDITWEQDQNGVANQAMDFDGVGDYIDTNLDTSLSTADFSVSAWVKIPDGVSTSYAVTQSRTVSYSSDWFLIYGPGDAIFWFRTIELGDYDDVNDGEWHHLVMNWDESEQKYEGFVDGVSIGISDTVSGYGGINSVKIGASGDGSFGFFNGSLSDVRIYDGALTSDQIMQLYKSGRSSGKMKVDAQNMEDGNYSANANFTTGNHAVYFDLVSDGYAHAIQSDFFEANKKYRIVFDITENTLDVGAQLELRYLDEYSKTTDDDGNDIDDLGRHVVTFYDTYTGGGQQRLQWSISSGKTGNTLNIENVYIVELQDSYSVGSLQKGLILDLPMNEDYSEANLDDISDDCSSDNIGDWLTIDTSLSFDTDHYVATYTDNTQWIYRSFEWNPNKKYFISYDIKDGTNSGVYVQVRNDPSSDPTYTILSGTTNASWQTISGIVSPLAGGGSMNYFRIYAQMTTAGNFQIKNIIIKELDATTKDRTPYGNDGAISGANLEYDGLVNGGNGIAYIPSDVAYGTWEFDIYKAGEVNYAGASFMDTSNSGRTNGYLLQINSAERVDFRRYTNGSMDTYQLLSSEDATVINNWYRFKITRSLDGVFTIYIKGGSFGWDDWTLVSGGSSNPFTDDNHTISNYFVPELDNGDKIRNLKINGKPVKLSGATQSTGTWTTTAPSYSFDGTDDYIDMEGAFDVLENNNPKTISFWSKATVDSQDTVYIYVSDGTSVTSFSRRPATGYFGYYSNFSVGRFFSVNMSAIDFTEWHHFLITDDGSSAKVFVDNQEMTFSSGGLWSGQTGDAQWIGKRPSNEYPLNGQMSNLKIWNRVLSADEIGSLYNKESRVY
jgi:hypothetical protein